MGVRVGGSGSSQLKLGRAAFLAWTSLSLGAMPAHQKHASHVFLSSSVLALYNYFLNGSCSGQSLATCKRVSSISRFFFIMQASHCLHFRIFPAVTSIPFSMASIIFVCDVRSLVYIFPWRIHLSHSWSSVVSSQLLSRATVCSYSTPFSMPAMSFLV